MSVPVSYTHLDVYKRHIYSCVKCYILGHRHLHHYAHVYDVCVCARAHVIYREHVP